MRSRPNSSAPPAAPRVLSARPATARTTSKRPTRRTGDGPCPRDCFDYVTGPVNRRLHDGYALLDQTDEPRERIVADALLAADPEAD